MGLEDRPLAARWLNRSRYQPYYILSAIMTILSAWLFVVLFAVLAASASADDIQYRVGRANCSPQAGEAAVIYGATYLIIALEVKNPTAKEITVGRDYFEDGVAAWRTTLLEAITQRGAQPGFRKSIESGSAYDEH